MLDRVPNLQTALELHRSGRLAEAAQAYRVLLTRAPRVDIYLMLASACQGLGAWGDAEASLRDALRLSPQSAEAHHCLGELLLRKGQLAEATTLYRRLTELAPDSARAYHHLAVLLERQGLASEAEAAFRQALALRADYAEAFTNLGNLLGRLQRFDEALACHRRAIELKPNWPAARYNLAQALARGGQLAEAAEAYRGALALAGNSVSALCNLAGVLIQLRRHDEAEAACREFLARHPAAGDVWNNLGTVLADQGRVAEAEACYRQALDAEPGCASAHNSLAGLALESQQIQAAIQHCQQALAARPDYPDAHVMLSYALFYEGRMAEAWPHYEWRLLDQPFRPEGSSAPMWDGSLPLAGRTVLLECEQGLGDALQFTRYAALVKGQGARVIVECSGALERLIARVEGVDLVVPRGVPLPPHELRIRLLSLPHRFATTLENVPAPLGYLPADPELVELWKQRLADDARQPGDLKIGIAWQGNPDHQRDRHRSLPLAQFRSLARDGVQLYSLQFGAGREQIAECGLASRIVDLGDRLGDFYETAAIVRNLDLVISCDSAVAHLAGGLGVPVWLAVAYVPDWRWMLERVDTPWYPTMRLFRQQRPGDWAGVLAQIRAALEEQLAGGAGSTAVEI